MRTEEIFINYLQKRIEKNNFAKEQKYERAAYSREKEKEIECDFFYSLVENDLDYKEFEYTEYSITSFRELLTKYLKDNYNIDIKDNFEVNLLNNIQKRLDRSSKINDIGI